MSTNNEKYLNSNEGYLTNGYLAASDCLVTGIQFDAVGANTTAYGVQLDGTIEEQSLYGVQFDALIDALTEYGVQFDSVSINRYGVQFNIAIYNTTNFRFLREFPSRGATETGGGNNAFGNPKGLGQNWDVSSGGQAAGDFDVENLNTDIVEQVYRSTATSVTLTCDTENTNTTLDTLGILNHNISQGASITLSVASDAAFSGVIASYSILPNPENMYFILPEVNFPPQQARYYRISVSDGDNADGYIQIGTVVFGAADVFQKECFVDQLDFQFQDFADTVETEGFTNVAVSRAQKRLLGLEFRSLRFSERNFGLLRDLFRNSRTVLKTLYIPTPSTTNAESTDRFAAFGKLAKVPSERHNHKGPEADYVDLSMEIDESL